MKLLILLIIPVLLIAEDNRMSQVQTFNGLINCMAVSNSGEVFVASDRGLYSLARGILSHNPVNAVDFSGDTIFAITMAPILVAMDMRGNILEGSGRALYQTSILPHGNMPPDSDEWHCIYPGLTGHFFLCNAGVYPHSGIWRLAEPPNVDGPYTLPQEIHGRRLRGLGWADNHFWIANANEGEQIIYKLRMNPGMRRLETVNILHRSLPNSSRIQGLAWHDGKLYVAFQVRDETVIHIYEGEATPRRNERD